MSVPGNVPGTSIEESSATSPQASTPWSNNTGLDAASYIPMDIDQSMIGKPLIDWVTPIVLTTAKTLQSPLETIYQETLSTCWVRITFRDWIPMQLQPLETP